MVPLVVHDGQQGDPQDGVDDQHAEVAQQDERGQRDDGAGGDDPADGGEAEEGRGGGGVGATSDGQRGLAADRGGGDVHRAIPTMATNAARARHNARAKTLATTKAPSSLRMKSLVALMVAPFSANHFIVYILLK